MTQKHVRAKPAPIPAEWCTGHHFMDTVRLWFPDYRPQTLPTAAEQAAHRHRAVASETREREMASADPWVRARAIGDLSKLGEKTATFAGRKA